MKNSEEADEETLLRLIEKRGKKIKRFNGKILYYTSQMKCEAGELNSSFKKMNEKEPSRREECRKDGAFVKPRETGSPILILDGSEDEWVEKEQSWREECGKEGAFVKPRETGSPILIHDEGDYEWEISSFKDSEEEDDEKQAEIRSKKKVPQWAGERLLQEFLQSKRDLGLETIFSSKDSFDATDMTVVLERCSEMDGRGSHCHEHASSGKSSCAHHLALPSKSYQVRKDREEIIKKESTKRACLFREELQRNVTVKKMAVHPMKEVIDDIEGKKAEAKNKKTKRRRRSRANTKLKLQAGEKENATDNGDQAQKKPEQEKVSSHKAQILTTQKRRIRTIEDGNEPTNGDAAIDNGCKHKEKEEMMGCGKGENQSNDLQEGSHFYLEEMIKDLIIKEEWSEWFPTVGDVLALIAKQNMLDEMEATAKTVEIGAIKLRAKKESLKAKLFGIL